MVDSQLLVTITGLLNILPVFMTSNPFIGRLSLLQVKGAFKVRFIHLATVTLKVSCHPHVVPFRTLLFEICGICQETLCKKRR